jgi:hypothetical protein
MQPLSFNNDTDNYDQQQQQQQSMMYNEDTYLPEEPVLLTDYEEERLVEHIRTQLGTAGTVDRLKLFFQELAAYDPNATGYIHYSHIQAVAYQLGVKFFNNFLIEKLKFLFSLIWLMIHFVLLCANLFHLISHMVMLIMKI